MFFTQAYPIFQCLTAVLPARYNMVVVVDTFLTEQAMPVLCGIDCIFHDSLSEQRSVLILPPLDMRVVHRHESKTIDFQHNIRNGQELLELLHQIDVRQEQMVRRWREPSDRTFPVVEPGFLVLDAFTGDRLLASGEDSLDDPLG